MNQIVVYDTVLQVFKKYSPRMSFLYLIIKFFRKTRGKKSSNFVFHYHGWMKNFAIKPSMDGSLSEVSTAKLYENMIQIVVYDTSLQVFVGFFIWNE